MNDDDFSIQEAQQGDLQAFGKLIQRYQKKAYNYALRLSHDPDLAQDLCQEAFIKGFCAMASFKGGASFSTWLYRILHNTFLDHYRKEKLRQESALETGQGETGQDKAGQSETPGEEGKSHAASHEAFSQAFRQLEQQDWLAKALPKLSLDFRSVLILRDVQGFSYEEIAKITSLSTGTVKSRLNRARQSLREILLSLDSE